MKGREKRELEKNWKKFGRNLKRVGKKSKKKRQLPSRPLRVSDFPLSAAS
jgi:hypothetical protein